MTDIPNNFALIRTLTDRLLDRKGPPFRLSINHNVGPPRHVACPLNYDWRHGKTVGIDTCSRPAARDWIGGALTRGYLVERLDKTGYNAIESAHLRSARSQAIRQAEREAMTPEQRQKELDEIPF